MCGRAYETYTDKELNARYIRGAPTADDIQQLILMPEPVYNLCPTMNSPVLRVVDGSRRLDLMHWQLIPRYESLFKTKLTTINAKSETVFTSSMFGELVERQRCIVPISGMPHAAYRLLCWAADYAESVQARNSSSLNGPSPP